MVPPAWVIALSSDDDEDYGQPRPVPQVRPAPVAQTDFYVEDDEVEVANVLKPKKPRTEGVNTSDTDAGGFKVQLKGNKSNGNKSNGREGHFAFPETTMLEPMSSKKRKRMRNEQKAQERSLLNRSEGLQPHSFGNVDKGMHNTVRQSHCWEQGILGGGPASQLRDGGNRIAGGYSSRWREQDIQGRRPAFEYCEGESSHMVQSRDQRGVGPDHHFVGSHLREGGAGVGFAPQFRGWRGQTGGFSDPSRELGMGGRIPFPLLADPHVPRGTIPGLERVVAGHTMNVVRDNSYANVGAELSRLHWNIVRFCDAYELTREQIQVREEALEHVRLVVSEILPNAEVQLFGSTATGLALPWSDIDLAVISSYHLTTSEQKPCVLSWLSALGRLLRIGGQCESVKQISHAKVPVLKVVFKSGVACDISIDVPNGPKGVPVIRQFMQQFEAMRPLCLVLKFFLGQLYLNELFTGGLGSFCLINMVVSHLQKQGLSRRGRDLGQMLLSFFDRYGFLHDYVTDVVSTRADSVVTKQAKGWVNLRDPELISVEDPLDPTSDIGKGSYKIHDIRNEFRRAHRLLLTHWQEQDVLVQIVDMTGNPSQRPQKVIRIQQGQQKRKWPDFVGGDMEFVHRRQKTHLMQQGTQLVGQGSRKPKKPKKPKESKKPKKPKMQKGTAEKNRAGKPGDQVQRVLAAFGDLNSSPHPNSSKKPKKPKKPKMSKSRFKGKKAAEKIAGQVGDFFSGLRNSIVAR